MIDLHCHLDLFPNVSEVIDQVESRRMYVLAVTTTPKAWDHLQMLIAGKPRIKAAIGLHPEVVMERYSEVGEVCSLISETKYVGEIGLDGSPHLRDSFSMQRDVFESILRECSKVGGRIMSIHSRSAAGAVLNSLEAYPTAGKPVLHWFSGTERELSRAISFGCWFSVGPAMLKSAKGRKLAKLMPRNRVLTESDGPLATIDNEILSPLDVAQAEGVLAEIWNVSSEEVRRNIYKNLRELISDRDEVIL